MSALKNKAFRGIFWGLVFSVALWGIGYILVGQIINIFS